MPTWLRAGHNQKSLCPPAVADPSSFFLVTIMNKELLLLIDAVSFEKGVPAHVVHDAIETALAGASRRQLGVAEARVRVEVNSHTGQVQAFRQWEVVADDERIEAPERQVRLMDALDEADDAEVGDLIEEQIEPPALGRMSAQTVKQILVQKVREGTRQVMRDQWRDRVGEVVIAEVRRRSGRAWHLDLGGGGEAVMPQDQQIPGEHLRPGNRVRVVIERIDEQAKGPQIVVSRTSEALLVALMRQEVPEIDAGAVQVKAVARDPGQRAKVAIVGLDKRVDPIGACIGMRGMRIQAVGNELGGERIDLVLWDDNPAAFVINAMAPASIEKLSVDEDTHHMDIGVAHGELAKAIGRGGQNIRLASRLTGWTLAAMETEALEKLLAQRDAATLASLAASLDLDEDVAGLLVEHGFTQVEEVAQASMAEMLSIEGFDEDIAAELLERANEATQSQALEREIAEASGLLGVADIDANLALRLVEAGVGDVQALADLSVDELLEMIELDRDWAGKAILAARAKVM